MIMDSTQRNMSQLEAGVIGEVDAFDAFTMPSRYSKHQTVFGKYAASHAASEGVWPHEDTAFLPHSPLTPSVGFGMEFTNQIVNVSSEMLTPESSLTLSPHELVNQSDLAGSSPLFDEADAGEDIQSWESLFLDEETSAAMPQQQAQNEAAQLSAEVKLEIADGNEFFDMSPQTHSGDELPANFYFSGLAQTEPPKPKASSGGVSKEPRRKVDDLGITVYKRKPRTIPLKPIEVPQDGDDPTAKRAKNTEAARRSRARKMERMSQLEERVRQLLDENELLRTELSMLRKSQDQ